MRTAQKILLIYATLLSVFIVIGAGINTIKTGNPLVFVLFLPVVIGLLFKLFTPNHGHRLLLYYNFIITTIMAVSGFINTRGSSEIISAILFIPICLYFWLQVMPRRNSKIEDMDMTTVPSKEIKKELVKENEKDTKTEAEHEKEIDIDRRTFIKLVGSVGLGVFFLTLFSKKIDTSFFGNRFGGQPNQALPANQTESTANYKISEIDDSNPAYFGFIDSSGKWYIMKETESGSFRYTRGDNNFSQGWKNRAKLNYDLFDKTF